MTGVLEDRPIPAGVRVMEYPQTDESPVEDALEAQRNSRWYFWTWLVTPHIEFGAIWVGMIVVLFLDMSLLQGLIGIFLGTAFGALSHGVLTARGVELKVPQIVLSKIAFGRVGNMVVTTVMALVTTYGWFVVNTVIAALALDALFDLPIAAGLAIAIVVQLLIAQFGRGFFAVQRWLYPAITVILVAAGIVVFTEVDPANDHGSPWDINGLIAIVVVACIAWAYTIGWTPYATDYSDYQPTVASPRAAGLAAGLGLFASTMFLMSVGVAAGIVIGNPGDNPTADFTGILPGWFAVVVLVTILAGTGSNNVIALASARGLVDVRESRLTEEVGRWIAPVVMSIVAFGIGWGVKNTLVANYEGFIMVIGFLVGPWLNVALIDHYIRRKEDPTELLYDETLSNKWGMFAVAFALVGAVCIYALQVFDDGRLPHGGVSYAALGMLAGFYLSGIVYGFGLKRMLKSHGRPGTKAS